MGIRSRWLYQTFREGSKVNAAHFWMSMRIVTNWNQQGAIDRDIDIFTTYAARRRLHKQMPQAGTIKTSHDRWYTGQWETLFNLDLITPGGRAHSLRFTADWKWSCVGLSRAKSGLIILGLLQIHIRPYPKIGCRVWEQLIAHSNFRRMALLL